MKKVFFRPWVGSSYNSCGIFSKKILVIGEAHICGGCPTCGIKYNPYCEDISTPEIITSYLKDHQGKWSRTFRKFERALVGYSTDNEQSEAIWNSIAFYNYIQVSMNEARTKPSFDLFKEGEMPFWEVVNYLSPDLIICWGKTRMYDNMPSTNWEKGDPIKHENIEALFGKYSINNGQMAIAIPTLWIAHPSSSFSWKKWHNIIKTLI